jgi:hypothetical protein
MSARASSTPFASWLFLRVITSIPLSNMHMLLCLGSPLSPRRWGFGSLTPGPPSSLRFPSWRVLWFSCGLPCWGIMCWRLGPSIHVESVGPLRGSLVEGP